MYVIFCAIEVGSPTMWFKTHQIRPSLILVPSAFSVIIAYSGAFMGGCFGSTISLVARKHSNSAEVVKFRFVMSARRSTYAGGESQPNDRFRSVTDASHIKAPKRQCSCLELVRETIPALANSSHKGQLGRIGIIGGCQE